MTSGLQIRAGECHIFFAYDVGLSINLDEVPSRIGTSGERKIAATPARRTPGHFGYQRPPVRVVDTAPALAICADGQGHRWTLAAPVESVLFEFGAVSVKYTIRLVAEGSDGIDLQELTRLSSALYENAALLADSRKRVEALLVQLRTAVKRPTIAPLVEDYVVYALHAVRCDGSAPERLLAASPTVASILRSEPGRLSTQEIDDAVAVRITYGPDDLALIDWSGALVLGPDMDDVLAVLEYANVELLELRSLDGELDRAFERTRLEPPVTGWRRILGLGPPMGGAALRRIAELQMDAATLFEEVNNSLKMLGDQYLARVYRLASQRLHLSEWDSTILRKLETLESMYEKLHNFETSRRLELLEWIVILLIAFEVVMSFVRAH